MRLIIGLVCYQSLSEAKAGQFRFSTTRLFLGVESSFIELSHKTVVRLQFVETPDKDGMQWRKVFTTRLFHRWLSLSCRRLQTRYDQVEIRQFRRTVQFWHFWPINLSGIRIQYEYFSANAIINCDCESDLQTDKSSIYSIELRLRIVLSTFRKDRLFSLIIVLSPIVDSLIDWQWKNAK